MITGSDGIRKTLNKIVTWSAFYIYICICRYICIKIKFTH